MQDWEAGGHRGEDRSLSVDVAEAALSAETATALAGWKMCLIATTLHIPLSAALGRASGGC